MSEASRTLSDLQTPCCVVDLHKVKRNAKRMLDTASKHDIKLRPHMKTHKCLEAGVLATGGTRCRIAVSNLSEAEFFADGQFDDILLTALFTQDKLPRMAALSERLERFHVMIATETQLRMLEDNPLPARHWSAFLFVDCGSEREGVLWNSDSGVEFAKRIQSSPHVHLYGLYCVDEHSYDARGKEQIQKICRTTCVRLSDFNNRLKAGGIVCNNMSIGSTPTSSQPSDNISMVHEIHPGNYTFYDLMQWEIGSNSIDDVAMRVATRVIGHARDRGQLLIDAGWIALSLDGKDHTRDRFKYQFSGHPHLFIQRMNQEIGLVATTEEMPFDKYPVGMMLFVLPYHACATASMHRRYYVHEGDEVKDIWYTCDGW